MIRAFIVLAFAGAVLPVSAGADDWPVTVELKSFFYGDNTEFLANPYRDGETLLGAQLRLDASLGLSRKARFVLGVQTDSRAGARSEFENVWPVIALEIGATPYNRFTLGTLHSGAFGREPWQGLAPDESGPHGLLPPLHLDTLAMTQSYDAGLQWRLDNLDYKHDVWLAWRRVNTADQREKFDLGYRGRGLIGRGTIDELWLVAQGHVVHEGGQLTHVGSVGDSLAGGAGLEMRWFAAFGTVQAEYHFLFSRHNPNRADRLRADRLDGSGLFTRLSLESGDWRAAGIYWFGSDFVKWQGDPNYGAVLNDDTTDEVRVASVLRTHAELSLTRMFELGADAYLSTNGRLYRIDGGWDYAYRVSASIRLSRAFGGK